MRNTLRLFISCYIYIMQTSSPTVHILWNYIFILVLAAKLATKNSHRYYKVQWQRLLMFTAIILLFLFYNIKI